MTPEEQKFLLEFVKKLYETDSTEQHDEEAWVGEISSILYNNKEKVESIFFRLNMNKGE